MSQENYNLTHTNEKGEAQMVDIANKRSTTRAATASCIVLMQPQTLQKIQNNSFKKGDVLAVARVAGIMAAKKTAELIPMCHQLNLSKVSVDFELVQSCNKDSSQSAIIITVLAKLTAQTGVEMEALTACCVAGLTIYDMCKAVDRFMQITEVKMINKSGGKSGNWSNI